MTLILIQYLILRKDSEFLVLPHHLPLTPKRINNLIQISHKSAWWCYRTGSRLLLLSPLITNGRSSQERGTLEVEKTTHAAPKWVRKTENYAAKKVVVRRINLYATRVGLTSRRGASRATPSKFCSRQARVVSYPQTVSPKRPTVSHCLDIINATRKQA